MTSIVPSTAATYRAAHGIPATGSRDSDAAPAGGQHTTSNDSLAESGFAVDAGAQRQVILGGRETLWLVVGAGADVFAVDNAGHESWFYIGRVEPGAAIVGSSREARHWLAARLEPGGSLRRIPMSDLQTGEATAYSGNAIGTQRTAEVAQAVDAGLHALHGILPALPVPESAVTLPRSGRCRLAGGAVATAADGGVVWTTVDSGRFTINGRQREWYPGNTAALAPNESLTADGDVTLDVRDTADLMRSGELWRRLTQHHNEYLLDVGWHISQLKTAHQTRISAARRASAEAVDNAESTLRRSAQATDATDATDGAEDHAVFACRLVADAAGLDVVITPGAGSYTGGADLVTRIAVASRIRNRPIKLEQEWWKQDIGPLVGYYGPDRRPIALLWRSGRYEAVDQVQGRRRVTDRVASAIHDDTVMFYRSLRDSRVDGRALIRFGLKGAGKDIARTLLGALMAFVLGLIVPITAGAVMGEFVPNGQYGLIVQACVAIIVVAFVAAAFSMVSAISYMRFQSRLDETMQSAIWDRMLRLPARFFARTNPSDVSNAAMGVSFIHMVAAKSLNIMVMSGMLGVANFGLLLWYSVPLALLTLAMLLVQAAVFTAIGVRRAKIKNLQLKSHYVVQSQVMQFIRGLPKLRVAAAEGFAYGKWAASLSRSRDLMRSDERLGNLAAAIDAGYLPTCTLVLFLVLSGPAAGSLTLPQFLSFITAFTITLAAASQLANSAVFLTFVVPMFGMIRPILEELPETRPTGTVPSELRGEIEIANVSFRYSDSSPLVLEDLSLHIKPGEFVAIVGPTGCGKSTLLRLLIGFEEPTSGVVRYDGSSLSQLDLSALRSQCGVVLQNGKPLGGTILSNICGNGTYTVDDAWHAAKLAGLDEDIKQMPMGMHTLVSDNADTLSGGQRQRLMIALAMIRNPKILFFDEATSALDNKTQKIVASSTAKLAATRVVIAHRLSTVMEADRVVVLAKGRIRQMGSPAELLADKDGLFYHLVQRQQE
jgi:NHLM bacteriocin system ABC transporter ATP-binding protein